MELVIRGLLPCPVMQLALGWDVMGSGYTGPLALCCTAASSEVEHGCGIFIQGPPSWHKDVADSGTDHGWKVDGFYTGPSLLVLRCNCLWGGVCWGVGYTGLLALCHDASGSGVECGGGVYTGPSPGAKM